jgi:hypothetical protein
MKLRKANVLEITPIQAVFATGTFTYLGTVATGQTLTIGTETYEATIDGAAVTTTGNIAFASGMGATCSTSVIDSLVACINTSGALVTAVTGGSGRVLTVQYNVTGYAGSLGEVHCSATLTGTWTTTSLVGTDGTPAAKATIAVDGSYLYFTKADNDIGDQYWYAVTGTLLT